MRAAATLLAVLLAGMPAAAQQADAPSGSVPRTSVVVLDRDALFAQSLFGQRAVRDLDAASTALAEENRRIQAELEAEERSLTELRAEMDRADFRQVAADFDARVNAIRQAQDAKTRAIAQQGERAQALFFEAANPILVALARETGALVILDRRMVIASADQVDITALARERIDAELGEGVALRQMPPPRRPGAEGAPEPVPDTGPETAPETAPEIAPDIAPGAGPAPEAAPQSAPDSGPAP